MDPKAPCILNKQSTNYIPSPMQAFCKEVPFPLMLGTAAPLNNGFGDLGADGVHSVCLCMTPLGVAAPGPGRLKGKLFGSAGAFGLRVALI